MIAVDTNILVYSHRRDSPWFAAAAARMRFLAEGTKPWGLPWPCIHEFVGIVTRPRIYDPPTEPARALEQAEQWLHSPSVTMLGEGSGYWEGFRRAVAEGQVVGAAVHDAHIAALCMANGVRELWTADRDFSRYPGLRVVNPLR